MAPDGSRPQRRRGWSRKPAVQVPARPPLLCFPIVAAPAAAAANWPGLVCRHRAANPVSPIASRSARRSGCPPPPAARPPPPASSGNGTRVVSARPAGGRHRAAPCEAVKQSCCRPAAQENRSRAFRVVTSPVGWQGSISGAPGSSSTDGTSVTKCGQRKIAGEIGRTVG